MNPRTELLEAICARETVQAELDAAALRVSRAAYACHLQGAAVKDLAADLGLSTQRVYQLLARAEKELREQYELEADKATYARSAIRNGEAARNRGMVAGSFPCFVCGRRKSRPSTTCDHCGDDPVSFNGDPREFDRAHGYA